MHEFVAHISDRLNCFVEDVIVRALQTQMPEGISISEIPVAERPPEIVERFQLALVGGGMPIWRILYHDGKFEDHQTSMDSHGQTGDSLEVAELPASQL